MNKWQEESDEQTTPHLYIVLNLVKELSSKEQSAIDLLIKRIKKSIYIINSGRDQTVWQHLLTKMLQQIKETFETNAPSGLSLYPVVV